MFGLTKYQILVIILLVVIAYHERRMFEAAFSDAMRIVTPKPPAQPK